MRIRYETVAFASAGMLALALLGWGASLLLISRLDEDRRRAVDALAALESARTAAVDSETGLRGYVLTGKVEFLEPYNSGRQDFDTALAVLRALRADAGLSPAEVQAIEDRYNAWLGQYAEPEIALVEAGNQPGAVTIVESGAGKAAFDALRAAFAGAEPHVREAVNRHGDASSRQVLAFMLTGLGSLAFAGAVYTGLRTLTMRRADVHALHEARAALAAERELSGQRADLLATWSHDLRNPLTSLVLNAEILEDEASREGTPELQELSSALSLSARRTASLAAELLDFSRLEAGSLQLKLEHVDLRDVVREAVADLRLTQPRAEVVVADETAWPPVVAADPPRLRMVLRNLLENAARYGAPPIAVRVGPGTVSVEDSGGGIPEAERQLIFERFQRGSTARGREGTGIGLYLARQVAQMHGGSLTIGQSSLGGAAFHLEIPLAPA